MLLISDLVNKGGIENERSMCGNPRFEGVA